MVGVVVFSRKKNWVGLGVGVSNCKKNWVGVVVGGCGQLKLGLGFGVAVHGLIGLGLWLGVSKPHFAHPCLTPKICSATQMWSIYRIFFFVFDSSSPLSCLKLLFCH